MRLHRIAWINITVWEATRGRSWSPFLAPRTTLKRPTLCHIWCLCDLSKGCRQFLQLSGLEPLRTRAGKRGPIFKASWLSVLSCYKLASMAERQGTGLLRRDEEERAARKRVFSILEMQFQSLGDQSFQKFRKDAHKENWDNAFWGYLLAALPFRVDVFEVSFLHSDRKIHAAG